MALANTRFSNGLRFTGIGAVSCGRGEMILPSAVGNLHQEERYVSGCMAVGDEILMLLLKLDMPTWTIFSLQRSVTLYSF
jgi:hypothetical protein